MAKDPKKKTSAKKSTARRVDWHAHHGPLTGTLNATAGTLAATALAHATGTPEWWALAAGGAGAAGTIGAGLRQQLTKLTLSFRGACWAAAGTWSAVALASGDPLAPGMLAALAVGGIGLGAASVGFRGHEETATARRGALLVIGQRRARAAEWIDRLERVCRAPGVTVPAIEEWPTGYGYTVEVELPAGAVSRRDLEGRADAIAHDLDLPDGCGVQVLPGVSRRRALILVRTRSMAGAEYMIPVEELRDVDTIRNPLAVGLTPEGARAELDFRQASTIVAGTTGTGKTNLLRGIMARQLACNDVLVWVIDFNGGGLASPFLSAWRDAQESGDDDRRAAVPAPGVDWVASTPAEARRMLAAASRIAKARKTAYKGHMEAADDDKLPIGPDLPEIMIVMDEAAEAQSTGTREDTKAVIGGLSEVIRIARAMAVRVIVSLLRVTSDTMPDMMVRKQASNRICTGATEDSELGHLFGWRSLKSEDAFDGPGTMLVGVEGKAPRPAMSWRILPSHIRTITEMTAHRRPRLDAPSLKAAGADYADRWSVDRSGHLFSAEDPAEAPAEATAASGPEATGGPTGWKATAGWGKPKSDRPAEATAASGPEAPTVAELEAMFNAPTADRVQAERDPDHDGGDPGTWTTRGERKRAADAATEAEAAGMSPAQAAALALILAAGPGGTGASAIYRELADTTPRPSRPTIQAWLKGWAESGLVYRVGEGMQVRYAHADHRPRP